MYIIDGNLSWRSNSPFVDLIMTNAGRRKTFSVYNFYLILFDNDHKKIIMFWLSDDELQI